MNDASADLDLVLSAVVQHGRLVARRAGVGRLPVLDQLLRQELRRYVVRGMHDGHVGQCSVDGQVFDGLSRRAVRSRVGSSVRTAEVDGKVWSSHAVSHLFKGAFGEDGKGAGEGHVPRRRHACRGQQHVLLANPARDGPLGVGLAEELRFGGLAQVGFEDDHLVVACELHQSSTVAVPRRGHSRQAATSPSSTMA